MDCVALQAKGRFGLGADSLRREELLSVANSGGRASAQSVWTFLEEGLIERQSHCNKYLGKHAFVLRPPCSCLPSSGAQKSGVQTEGKPPLPSTTPKYESPSFLPGRKQPHHSSPVQKVDHTRIQGLSSFPSERLLDRVVMVRCDWNVEISVKEDGQKVFKDDASFKASLPTIQFLTEGGAKVVVLSQFWTPGKGQRLQHSLNFLADRLALELKREVLKAADCVGEAADDKMDGLESGQVLVLENVAFYKEEKANDLSFAQKLASGVDIFVSDALGPCSQASASICGVPLFVGRRMAGLHLEKELQYLNSIMHAPARPLVAVVGSGKLSTRYSLLKSLITRHKCDRILLGSSIAAPFLKALGWRIGSTPVEINALECAQELLDLAKKEGVEIVLPTDVVCGDRVGRNAKTKVCSAKHILQEWSAMDVGQQTVAHYAGIFRKAKTVLWVGSLGYSDWSRFSNGTHSLVRVLSDLTRLEKCTTILQGKDLERAVKVTGSRVSHITLGGSAAMALLTGGALPGLAVLDEVPTGPPEWSVVYKDPGSRLTVDIGCGDGDFLFVLACCQPDKNFLGLDLFGHLVDAANKRALMEGLESLHYIQANATTSLGPILSTYPGFIDLITIQCPTPQFEARGLGRLVLKQPLVEAIVENLIPMGRLYIQTDVEEVAESMISEIEKHCCGELRLRRESSAKDKGAFKARSSRYQEESFDVLTQWEEHALGQGRKIFRLLYRKNYPSFENRL